MSLYLYGTYEKVKLFNSRKIGCNFSSVDLSMVKPYTNGKFSLRAFQKCTVLLCSDEYHESYRRFSGQVLNNYVPTGTY